MPSELTGQVVETDGLEPSTPAVSERCSTQAELRFEESGMRGSNPRRLGGSQVLCQLS